MLDLHTAAVTPGDPRARERGTVLIMVLAFSMLIGTMLVGTITTTVLQAKTMRHELDATYAQGLAEGATELAQWEMVQAAANFEDPPLTGVVNLDGRAIEWSATALGGPVERTDVDGVRMIGQPYEIVTTVSEGVSTSKISRVVDLTLTPMHQYAIFFNMLCEISPDAAMGIQGRVHVNGDLYLDTPDVLQIDTDHIHATGEIHRGRLDADPREGKVMIREFDGLDFFELAPDADSTTPGWIQSSLQTWSGSVKSGDHSVERVTGPSHEVFEPGGYYATSAGLRIEGTTAYNSSGAVLSLPSGVVSEKSFTDDHVGKTVTVTEIDIAALTISGHYPTNGLIYVNRPDSSEFSPNGVRLVNGSTLPTPLTLVTQNPLYIQGDFNTVNKQPAAVVADTVNLLSNAWDDDWEYEPTLTEKVLSDGLMSTLLSGGSESSTSSGSRPNAADTRYNLSVVTGAALEGGTPSGGFENLLRLHENWSGQSLDVLGALVVLFESQFATGPVNPLMFTDPTRNFAFDNDLLDPSKLPPYPPSGVYMRRVLWDDHKPISFKIADSRLSLFPSTPVYDPWNYDDTFMGKVVDDPNLLVEGGRKVDYSDKVETEAPDTADRNVKTDAELKDDQLQADYAAAAAAAAAAANDAIFAKNDAEAAAAAKDLVGAQTAALAAETAALAAQAAYEASNKDPTALTAVQKARDAAAAARAAADSLLKI